jgi:hypothetical protein
MFAGVPQFIEIEDKIAFGLTAKQLLWIGGGVALLVLSYSLFDRQLFYAVGIFIAAIFGSMAFWRPQGLSMVSFLGFTLQYFLKPKKYVWKRMYLKENLDMRKASLSQTKNAPLETPQKHLPARGQLKKIAWELDTRR